MLDKSLVHGPLVPRDDLGVHAQPDPREKVIIIPPIGNARIARYVRTLRVESADYVVSMSENMRRAALDGAKQRPCNSQWARENIARSRGVTP